MLVGYIANALKVKIQPWNDGDKASQDTAARSHLMIVMGGPCLIRYARPRLASMLQLTIKVPAQGGERSCEVEELCVLLIIRTRDETNVT